jgi:hypothetical protein
LFISPFIFLNPFYSSPIVLQLLLFISLLFAIQYYSSLCLALGSYSSHSTLHFLLLFLLLVVLYFYTYTLFLLFISFTCLTYGLLISILFSFLSLLPFILLYYFVSMVILISLFVLSLVSLGFLCSWYIAQFVLLSLSFCLIAIVLAFAVLSCHFVPLPYIHSNVIPCFAICEVIALSIVVLALACFIYIRVSPILFLYFLLFLYFSPFLFFVLYIYMVFFFHSLSYISTLVPCYLLSISVFI